MSKIFKDELYTGFLINPEIVALKEANVELNKRIGFNNNRLKEIQDNCNHVYYIYCTNVYICIKCGCTKEISV